MSILKIFRTSFIIISIIIVITWAILFSATALNVDRDPIFLIIYRVLDIIYLIGVLCFWSFFILGYLNNKASSNGAKLKKYFRERNREYIIFFIFYGYLPLFLLYCRFLHKLFR